MDELIPPPTPAPYKNRRAWLIVFGVLEIILGCIFALFVPLIIIGAKAGDPAFQSSTQSQSISLIVVMYSALAITMIWLGVGSILARRWARALSLIASWFWLVIGAICVVAMAFILPGVIATAVANANRQQPGAGTIVPAIMVGGAMIFVFIFVVIPLIGVLFYRGKNVQATCEVLNPSPAWTDACPLPLLGLSVLLLTGVPMFLWMLSYGSKTVLPLFGTFLVGPPAALVCVALALIWGYAAWTTYRREWIGWWAALIVTVIFAISSTLTYSRHSILELYALMGYPADVIERMKFTGIATGSYMLWCTLVSSLLMIGYMLYAARFLKPRSAQNEATRG